MLKIEAFFRLLFIYTDIKNNIKTKTINIVQTIDLFLCLEYKKGKYLFVIIWPPIAYNLSTRYQPTLRQQSLHNLNSKILILMIDISLYFYDILRLG